MRLKCESICDFNEIIAATNLSFRLLEKRWAGSKNQIDSVLLRSLSVCKTMP